jgi:nitrogen regulatory protein P-II 2
MATVPLSLLTVIAEPVLEDRIVRMLHAQGATGHTITESRGEGSRGVRATETPGENIRIEAIVAPEVGERILERLAADYFANFAVIAWTQDVRVVRGEKYA